MIEDSIHSGRYPLDQDIEKQMEGLVQVINRSSSDDLKEKVQNRNKIKGSVCFKQLYSEYPTPTRSN